MITDKTREAIFLYKFYPKILVESGGLYDQPNWYIKAMELLESLKNGG